MTREEAKDKYIETSLECYQSVINLIDSIYDDFEEHSSIFIDKQGKRFEKVTLLKELK